MDRIEIATYLLGALIAEPPWVTGADGEVNPGMFLRLTDDMEGCDDDDRFSVAALRLTDTLLKWSERNIKYGEVMGDPVLDDADDAGGDPDDAGGDPLAMSAASAAQALWPFPSKVETEGSGGDAAAAVSITYIGPRLVPIPLPNDD